MYYNMFFWRSFFWQLWLVGCAGCTVFGCFWQTNLCTNFGQQFFSGPRYVVNTYCLLSDELRMNKRYQTKTNKNTKLDNVSRLLQTQWMTSSGVRSSWYYGGLFCNFKMKLHHILWNKLKKVLLIWNRALNSSLLDKKVFDRNTYFKSNWWLKFWLFWQLLAAYAQMRLFQILFPAGQRCMPESQFV